MALALRQQVPQNLPAPSLSSFALKLETYLRMIAADTTYENTDFSKLTSLDSWITLDNSEDFVDSIMCVNLLKNFTNVDLNSHLFPSDKAIARAFQKMVEGELFGVVSLWRWTYDKSDTILNQIGIRKFWDYLRRRNMRKRIKKYASALGLGRCSQTEVIKIGQDDIKALAEFLDNKKYFMGDLVSEVDSAIFGLLAQLVYTCPTCPLTITIRGPSGTVLIWDGELPDRGS